MPKKGSNAPKPQLVMVMAPKSATSSRKKKSKGKGKKGGMKMEAAHPAVVEKICSLTDPFCSAAKLSKFPDATNIGTLTYQCHNRFQLPTTNAAGSASMAIALGWNYQVATGTVASGIATYTTFDASLQGLGVTPSMFRINSWGFVIRNTGSLMTASGMMRVRWISNGNSGFTSIDTASYQCDLGVDIPVTSCSNAAFVGRKLSASASDWYDPNVVQGSANVSTYKPCGWEVVQLSLNGGGASVASNIDVEIYINYELSFDDGSAMSQLATPSPPESTSLQSAASHVSTDLNLKDVFLGGIQEVAKDTLSHAFKYAKMVARAAILG